MSLFSHFIMSAIMSSISYLFDAFLFKYTRPFYHYVIMFMFFLSILLAFDYARAEACIFDKYLTQKPGIILTTGNNSKPKCARDAQKELMKRCEEQKQYHHDEAQRCFKAAEDACLLLPGDQKERADWCFASAIATLYPGSPAQRVVAGIITLVAQYGNAVMNEWQKIDSLLKESKYHFEMEQHYV